MLLMHSVIPQELFFSRPETTWSAPLAGPTPSDHQARPVRRSLDMLAKMEANPMAASPTRQNRASKGSSISHLNSTPRTGDHGHKATSSEGLSSAEHATIKVATPVLDFAEYAKQRSSVLSAPFEVRMSGGRTNARRSSEGTLARSFERGQEDWTEDDARPPRALLPNAFLESPYVTQTEYGSDLGHGLVNRSDSDNSKSEGLVCQEMIPDLARVWSSARPCANRLIRLPCSSIPFHGSPYESSRERPSTTSECRS
jgi:hypothetical protein